jgi:hypothetical protein
LKKEVKRKIKKGKEIFEHGNGYKEIRNKGKGGRTKRLKKYVNVVPPLVGSKIHSYWTEGTLLEHNKYEDDLRNGNVSSS